MAERIKSVSCDDKGDHCVYKVHPIDTNRIECEKCERIKAIRENPKEPWKVLY